MVGETWDGCLRGWVCAACEVWRYPEPAEAYYDRIARRLPEGLRTLVAAGVTEGLIIPRGYKFTLKGLIGKAPYAWFSQRSTPKEPSPNWEYFIQVAEFVRLSYLAGTYGLKVTFEDQWMDLVLYRDSRLVVCYEVKERASQIEALAKGVRAYEAGVNFSQPDRGNDPLRKAKYLVRRRPDYFSLIAIGVRLEYRVSYPKGRAFALVRDVIPWG